MVRIVKEASFPITLWMAGDIIEIKRYVREFVNANPICVTVTETNFMYVGGEEKGARIGFAHYPRFPLDDPETTLMNRATEMAKFLIEKCFQRTALIETLYESIWVTTMSEEE